MAYFPIFHSSFLLEQDFLSTSLILRLSEQTIPISLQGGFSKDQIKYREMKIKQVIQSTAASRAFPLM